MGIIIAEHGCHLLVDIHEGALVETVLVALTDAVDDGALNGILLIVESLAVAAEPLNVQGDLNRSRDEELILSFGTC